MAKFAQLIQGFRAVKVIDLPIASQPHGLQSDTPEQAEARASIIEAPKVAIRALRPDEREAVLEAALARAASKGATGDLEKNPIYNQALAVYTVAMACVDPDTVRGEPSLYFGDSLEQAAEAIRTSNLMTDDIVVYIRERQEAWQDQINPQALTLRDSELYDVAQKAVEDADFLWLLRPGMLVSYTRLLASLLLTSLADNSATSSVSVTDSTKPPKPKRAKS